MSETIVGARRQADGREARRTGKRFAVQTFGCQMNEHDSERIAGLFELDGMERVNDPEAADVIFINTCTIRENADNRLYGNLGQLKRFKDEHPEAMLVVGGCAAQKDRALVRERAPWVDVVLGTHNIDRVLDLMDHAERQGGITEIVEELSTMPSLLPASRGEAYKAWVTIQVGCNNTCTFCIVPSVRGPEVSRRPGDILAEVEALADGGVVEVTLLGQNVNTYGRDLAIDGRRRPVFADLLRRVGAVEGIRRVRFTSPHPADMREDVIAAMAETDAVVEQLHLPLQSGSDRILAAMHRGYTASRFMEKLALARREIADLSVSTDVIVGFPGETDEDFEATMRVIEEARFDQAFTFIFSPRPGTAAAEMTDRFVDEDVIRRRYGRLVEVQNRISYEQNLAQVGRTVEVLTEGPSKKDPSRATTRTRGNRVVHLQGSYPVGEFLSVTITGAGKHHLLGEPS